MNLGQRFERRNELIATLTNGRIGGLKQDCDPTLVDELYLLLLQEQHECPEVFAYTRQSIMDWLISLDHWYNLNNRDRPHLEDVSAKEAKHGQLDQS